MSVALGREPELLRPAWAPGAGTGRGKRAPEDGEDLGGRRGVARGSSEGAGGLESRGATLGVVKRRSKEPACKGHVRCGMASEALGGGLVGGSGPGGAGLGKARGAGT